MYKLCPRINCKCIVDNINYCTNRVKASSTIDEVDESNNTRLEHTFDKNYNNDCVSLFRKSGDDDTVDTVFNG